jgi:predicted AAA+ superfamily ATPase
VVFLQLRRLYGEDIYYYKTKEGKEVDFYLPKKKMFIQVCQSLNDPETRVREQGALFEAMAEVRGSGGLIITEDEKGSSVVPVYEWLLTDFS